MKNILIIISSLLLSVTPELNSDDVVLNYLVKQPLVASAHPPVLIMLHGVGSNEKDLFSLANQIDERFLVISAQAPYYMGDDRYGWYEINFQNGKPNINEEQANKSRETLLRFIEQIIEKYSVDTEKIYLMGFSQGAIMSFSIGLTRPEKVAGIACFSGRVLQTTEQNMSKDQKLQDLRVFLAHSTNDNVLNYQYALESKELLARNGIKTEFVSDNVGHSISPSSLAKFSAWLKSN
ncbi:MAG: PHB depolymerase family esterase [Flavobacteriales bacterium]